MNLLPILAFAAAQASTSGFALHDKDTVVFYGDSITEQRLYTVFAEQFVVTRYPKLDIKFVHSGWGGDRVSGGLGGTINKRLDRDVLPYAPTMVTVMLGMNDGSYRPLDAVALRNFTAGYDHILDYIKRRQPDTHFTLIQPSPYDDVTRAPTFQGGYNDSVLHRFGDYVKDLAVRNHAILADLNTPVVAMLQEANKQDPALAPRIIQDRVHPGPGGHLVMAEALLKAWGANGTISAVTLDGGTGRVSNATSAHIDALKRNSDGSLTWTETEDALPFPLDVRDPVVALAVKSSDFVSSMNNENLTVTGLDGSKSYTLAIDGTTLPGTFTADQLAQGINLSNYETPMMLQAREVGNLVRTHTDVHVIRWRSVQVAYETQSVGTREYADAMKALDKYEATFSAAAHQNAQPRPHRFSLTPQ